MVAIVLARIGTGVTGTARGVPELGWTLQGLAGSEMRMIPELLELLQFATGISGPNRFSENDAGNCKDCCETEAFDMSEG